MEIEFKYTIPDLSAGEQVLNAQSLAPYAVGNAVSREMASRYYDSHDGTLSARHYTLRLRREGSELVLCAKWAGVKLGGGLSSRQELEFCVSFFDEGLEKMLLSPLPEDFKDALRQELHICAEVDFTRRAQLFDLGTFSMEAALDKGLFAKKVPFCELEFELKSGSADAMEEFVKKLAEIYQLTPQPLSKLSRALRANTNNW